jgi:hypothetical protein
MPLSRLDKLQQPLSGASSFEVAKWLTARDKILHMSIDTARAGVATWKKNALDRLKLSRELVREFKGNLDKLCNGVKTLSKDVCRGAEQLGKQYDKYLDEDDENYYEDSGTMDALQGIPNANEKADDVKLQAGESLEELLAYLDETISTIQEIQV